MADHTIVVGDVHIAPGQSLKRAVWLGRLIADVKPNRVIYIGDVASFDSFSGWDKDKRKLMEGRRFSKEIDTLREFNRIVRHESAPFAEYETIITEGNHENRIDRYIESKPELEGVLDYAALAGLDWQIVPYKSYYRHGGITFTHVPIMENGKPVSGKSATDRALQICSNSIVFGHTHKLDYKATHRHGSPHLQEALNVGCYFEHVDEYAKGSVTSYWRGLVILNHYSQARMCIECLPMGLLKQEYA